MDQITEPTAEQCEDNEVLADSEDRVAIAIWYPQMGGYSGKAVAIMSKNPSTCVDMLVWHNGDFPFGDGKSPVAIHHCDPMQFVRFGQTLQTYIDNNIG